MSSDVAAEMVPIESIVPWPENPKTPTRKRITALAKMIKEIGFAAPIIARESDRMIAAGHTRWLAAKSLKMAKVPVRFMVLTDDQFIALALADNRLAEDQPWQQDNVKELLERIEASFDPLDLGFDEKEVERMLNRRAKPVVPLPLSDDDLPFDAPEESTGVEAAQQAPRQIVVLHQQLWQLGEHRLLIGDCKSRENVQRLFSGKRAVMMFTDPPYGVDYKATSQKKNAIAGDLSQAEFPISLSVAIECALSPDARIYICGGNSNFAMVNALFEHHLRMWPRVIVWVKEGFVLRQSGYHSRWEAIFHGWLGQGGGKDHWYAGRDQDDVWEVARVRSGKKIHPTEKPPELAMRALRVHSRPEDIVFDPFLGSGSTLIGAERENRVCYGMEIDENFGAGIIRRWEEETGRKAELIL